MEIATIYTGATGDITVEQRLKHTDKNILPANHQHRYKLYIFTSSEGIQNEPEPHSSIVHQ